MAVSTTCPQCERKYHLPEKLLGKKVRCQTCSAVFVVTAPSAKGTKPQEHAEKRQRHRHTHSAADEEERSSDNEGLPRGKRRRPAGKESGSAVPLLVACATGVGVVLALVIGLVVWVKKKPAVEQVVDEAKSADIQGQTRAKPDALDEILAALDRDEPGWRTADLQRKRSPVPDDQNGALCVLAVMKQLPSKWPNWPGDTAEAKQKLEQELNDPPATAQLTARQRRALESELGRASAALREARRLTDLPRGRVPADWTGNADEKMVEISFQDARSVAGMLCFESLLHAERGNLEEAVTLCRAALNAGRSLGDEPVPIAQLVRVACRTVVLFRVERVLAQGEPASAALVKLQELLAEEAEQPLLRYSTPGERSYDEWELQAIESGRRKPDDFLGADLFGQGEAYRQQLKSELQAPSLRNLRATLLRLNTQCVRIAGLPFEDQRPKIAAMKSSVERLPKVAQNCWLAFETMAAACRRHQADMRCAVVGIALERYRQQHKNWPNNFQELVPEYLARVPNDPCDGKPLRYRRVEHGVLVYSVGLDEQDNAGAFDRDSRKPGTDRVFRLWDVERRRQPAE